METLGPICDLIPGASSSHLETWKIYPNKKRPKNFVPDDFIWFFIHLTRWPEFEEIAQNIEGTTIDPWVTNPACKSSELIREALNDNWEDKEFYETFSCIKSKG